MLSATVLTACVAIASASQRVLQSGQDAFELSRLASDDRDLLRSHKHLIEAESTSQGLEYNAAEVLVQYFEEIDWSFQLLPTFGNTKRPNVFAWPGKTNHTKLLVTSHIDTVPPYIPYSIHDGAIWGRGSADAKASVATQIEAIRRLIRKDMILADDVAVLYVVGIKERSKQPLRVC